MATTFEFLSVGDVISLSEEECHIFDNASSGEYVVEETNDSGGWFVRARKLNVDGSFSNTGCVIHFHQCSGYINSFISPNVIGQMTRIFV